MTATPQEAASVLAEADCLHDESAVQAALDRMAADITARLGDSNPLVLCVLTGGVVAAGHLLTRLHFPLQLDYLHATRYRGATRGGDELHWLAHPRVALAGRSVLVVDDILDEGHTLAGILEHCREQGAREVLCAVLVEKLHDRRNPHATAEFIGLTVPDRYVFGYGMDYREYLRNAPGIYAVKGL
ncbi:MAG: hypoxanthine-guanine phosphoribosyltransferase [Chromatiales bacterium]|jgi:hypoxanthine phosphoribosyltransferase|nr:hypoxanthine-guanine phosphoribosyltransferase [Chromatiales bacterium]MDX9767686.1 hypoxanthine-guanine phosphoribosyltransferase [Ectothiorhodospiraceae bacterium]